MLDVTCSGLYCYYSIVFKSWLIMFGVYLSIYLSIVSLVQMLKFRLNVSKCVLLIRADSLSGVMRSIAALQLYARILSINKQATYAFNVTYSLTPIKVVILCGG